MAEKKSKAWHSGKKAYIAAAIMFIVAGLHAIKAMIPVLRETPDAVFEAAMAFAKDLLNNDLTWLAALGGALRAGIAKVEK